MNRATQCSVLVALSSVISSSIALQGWPQQGTIVEGNAIQFTQSTWDRNLAQPNATGNYSISGYDISKDYSTDTIDGWKLSVNVTSSIPDNETLNSGSGTGKAYTGTSIFLTAPDSVVSSVESNPSATSSTPWKICVTVMTNGPNDAASASDNGTCSYLSAQCISDFKRAWADQFARQLDCYDHPATPSSCGDSLNRANLTTQQFPIDHLNGTEIFVTASDTHDSSDTAAFTTAMNTVWPVLVVWGWNTRANVSDDTRPGVQLSCVRAVNLVEGSTSPSSDTAPTPRGSAIFAFGIAALVAVLLI